MIEYISGHLCDALRRHICALTVNIIYILVLDLRIVIHCLDIIHTEGKNISVIDSVYYSVCMKPVAKGLFRCKQPCLCIRICIFGEYRCTGKSENMILFEMLDYCRVHISELAAVTFIKNDNDMFLIYFMSFVFADKG